MKGVKTCTGFPGHRVGKMHHVWPNQLTSIFGDDEAIPDDLLYLLVIYDIFLGSLFIMANPIANAPYAFRGIFK